MSSTTEPQPPGSRPKAQKISSPRTHSKFGTLWSRSLPSYSGGYPVGAVDVEFKIPAQRIGRFEHKKIPGQAGIEIDTSLFTLFYPCQVDGTREKGALWFPRFGPTINGFLKMAGKESWWIRNLAYIPAFPAVYGLKFPVYQRAPILKPPLSNGSDTPGQWPLIIFSHGVGCSRLMYTHICGELASRGYVVAAVEHRDGTGPSAKVTSETGEEKDIDFLRWTDLHWPEFPDDQQPLDDTILRHDQLTIRLVEMDAALTVIKRLTTGELGCSGKAQNLLQASRTYDWSTWSDAIDLQDGYIHYAGHSFGGTAVIAAAADSRFNPASVIAMDPAMQRLDPWKGSLQCPFLAINSEEFSDSDDYDRLLEMLPTAQAEKHVLSIAGTTHPSFSDVFLITPHPVASLTGLKMPPYEVFSKTLEIIDNFLPMGDDVASTKWDMFAVGKGLVGRPKRPIGLPGEVLIQEASDGTTSNGHQE